MYPSQMPLYHGLDGDDPVLYIHVHFNIHIHVDTHAYCRYSVRIFCLHTLHTGSILYVYGGWDGQKAHNSLHKLNLKTFAWSEVKVENPDEAPPEMSGCGLVAHGNRLVLFGGYGELNEKKEKGKADERDQQHTPVEGETNATAATGQDSGSGDSNRNEGTKETDSATVEPAVNGVEEQTETGTVDTTAKGVEEQTESRSLEPAVNGVEEQTESRTVEPVVNGVEEQTESRTLEPAAVNGVEEDDWVKETLALVTIADVSGEGVGEGGMKSREGDAEKKKVAEGKEVKQPLENGRQEDDNAAVKVSNKSSEMTVEVTESVKEKSRKAVVIKLPVSYELADETGDKAVATTEDQNTNTAPKEQTNGVESVSVAEGGEVGVHVGQKEDDGEEERNTTFSIYRRNESDQKGWTNEVKVFDLDTGKPYTYTCTHTSTIYTVHVHVCMHAHTCTNMYSIQVHSVHTHYIFMHIHVYTYNHIHVRIAHLHVHVHVRV